MAENEKGFIQQFIRVFTAIPLGKKISFVIMIGMVVGGFIALMMWTNRPDYQVLFSNLDTADAGRILERLREKRIPFQLKEGGSAVMVPDEMVYKLRLELASKGIPRGKNVGFEIFDEMRFGTSEFVQRLKYQQAIQGELARTIMGFDAIENARVHIVSAGDSLFAEQEKPSTASVVLRLHSGRALNNRQLQGIINLVARAVKGLKSENITVVDMAGGLLSKGLEEDDIVSLGKNQFDHRQKLEKNLEKRIQTMLESVIGLNKVVARVSAELDFGQVSILEERYDPDSIAVRSEQRQKESSGGASSSAQSSSGAPDLQSQIRGSQGGSGGAAQNFNKESTIINYEMNKINKQITNSVGGVKRLSAAVIIDGPYVTEKSGPDGKEVQKFVARSRREMKTFEDIIKNAIGFNEARGDQVNVSNIPFAIQGDVSEIVVAEKGSPWLENVKKASKPLLNVVLVVLFFFLAIKPFKRWLSQTGEYIGTMALPAGGDIPQLSTEAGEGGMDQARHDQLADVSKSSPDVSAEIIRGWINEEK